MKSICQTICCSKSPVDPARKQYYFRHSGLDPESSNTNIGALCAPLDTGLTDGQPVLSEVEGPV